MAELKNTVAYDELPQSFEGSQEDELKQFVVGPLQTNCYAYISGGEAMVIDPAARGREIGLELIDYNIKYVVATHGHGDHVGGVYDLVTRTDAEFLIHKDDEEQAGHAGEVSELGRSYDHDAPHADRYLKEGDQLELGTATFRVLETPGHTPGGIVLLGGGSAEGIAFVGDTLFMGSCGRTDLKGGDSAQMKKTLARLKEEIPPVTRLFCGHGPETSMAYELKMNPYLQEN